MHTIPPVPTVLQPDTPQVVEIKTQTEKTGRFSNLKDNRLGSPSPDSDQQEAEVITFRARSNSLVRKSHFQRNHPRSYSITSDPRQNLPNSRGKLPLASTPSSPSPVPTNKSFVTEGVKNSDRSKRSGMSNVTQRMPFLSLRSPSPQNRYDSHGAAAILPAGTVAMRSNNNKNVSTINSSITSPLQHKSIKDVRVHIDSRVPIGVSHTDSPVLNRSSAARRALNFGGDLTHQGAQRGNNHQPPSSVQLETPLEEEEEEEKGMSVVSTSCSKENEDLSDTPTDAIVKSVSLIDRSSPVFQVDAKELQVTVDPSSELARKTASLSPVMADILQGLPQNRTTNTAAETSNTPSPVIPCSRNESTIPSQGRQSSFEENPCDLTHSAKGASRKTPLTGSQSTAAKRMHTPYTHGDALSLPCNTKTRAKSSSPVLSKTKKHSSAANGVGTAISTAMATGVVVATKNSTSTPSPTKSRPVRGTPCCEGVGGEGGGGGGVGGGRGDVVSSTTLPRRSRHTVAFKGNSPRGESG